jgi:hypothetical protein
MIKDFVYDDGGRIAAGYKDPAGDCVCRAVTIASGRSYAEVRDRLRRGTGRVRHSKRRPSPDNGIYIRARWFTNLMTEFGFVWEEKGDLPDVGRFVVMTRGHAFAVVNTTARDTHMRRLADRRFGYWRYAL